MPVQVQIRFVPMTPRTPCGSCPWGGQAPTGGSAPRVCVEGQGGSAARSGGCGVRAWCTSGGYGDSRSPWQCVCHTCAHSATQNAPGRSPAPDGHPRWPFFSARGVAWARRWLTTTSMSCGPGLAQTSPPPRSTPMSRFSWNGGHALWAAGTYDAVASCAWTVRFGRVELRGG